MGAENGKLVSSGASDSPPVRISQDRLLAIAHRLIDQLAAESLPLYHRLNNRADVPELAEQVRWWLERHGVDVC